MRGLAWGILTIAGTVLWGSPAEAAPVSAAERVVAGVPVRVVTVDLRDPDTVLDLVLAGNRPRSGPPRGQAPFSHFVAQTQAAVLVNGTFFSLDAEKRLMGTMVQTGKLVNHVSFRPHGTTFGLRPGNRPELVAAGTADWRRYWVTLTAGPRLLTDGRAVIRPRAEGFTDPAVVRPATRSALGFTRDGGSLILASFHAPVSLDREASVMRLLGCHQALNLDGGACRALAERGRVRVMPGRPLTNVLAVYDATAPASPAVRAAYRQFVYNRESPAPLPVAGRVFDPGPFTCGRRSPLKHVGTSRPYSFEDWLFTRVSGRPAVWNHDGWLALNGTGAIAAPWHPRRASSASLAVSLLARLQGPTMGLHLTRGPWLEVRSSGWILRQGARELASRVGPVDRERHHYRFEVRDRRLSVFLDGRPLLSGPVDGHPTGLGLSGHGAFKSLERSL